MSTIALIGVARAPTVFRRTSELQSCNAACVGYGVQRLPTDPVGSATLTFSGLQAGSDIVVTLAGTSTELLNVDAHAGTSYGWLSDRYVAPTLVDIGIFKVGFVPYTVVRNFTLPLTATTLPINQVADRNYSNP